MKDALILLNGKDSLKEKIGFLSNPVSYGDTLRVDAVETHMSWVFLTDRLVYKLKKPVIRSFLDFSTLTLRHRYCLAEVRVNKALAGDTYLGVVTLCSHDGRLQLEGTGEVVEWLVKMKRLPDEYMLHTAIKEGRVKNEWVQRAAEKLTDFYLASGPAQWTKEEFHNGIVRDIEANRFALINNGFDLPRATILNISAALLHFAIKHADLFNERMSAGRVVDCHGDLRPEHICLQPDTVMIDRIEFDESLRIMDVAEELSFLALECEIISSPGTGQLFLNVYKWKSGDKVPEMLIFFYKAKRAFLRAKLSISHLLESRYLAEEDKWRGRCDAYLGTAAKYCELL